MKTSAPSRPAAPSPSTVPAKGARPARPLAPPPAQHVSLPLRFILTGIAAFCVGGIWLFLRPDLLATYHYNQYVIAVTHLFTLGAISSIIMGAVYQLVPVALETSLYSPRLAAWHFLCHLVGFSGMIWMFWDWNMAGVGHFGSLVGLGIGLFTYNIGRTLHQSKKRNPISAAIAAAMGWLFLTMLAGLYLAASKYWTFSPFRPISAMHAHAHLGGVGFFLMMLVGVSYKLVPMFTLSELQSSRRAWASVILLNVGLILVFFTVLLDSPWKLAAAGVVCAGLLFYGWELAAILKHRKRRTLDWGVRYFLTGVLFLIPLCALALTLCWPGLPANLLTTQLENVYGFLALVAVLSLAICGMLYKIVPFLVWYKSYSHLVGRRKVPSLGDLYSARLQAIGYFIFVAAVIAVAFSTALANPVAVKWSSGLLALGYLLFAANMLLVLRHWVLPKTEPSGAVGALGASAALRPKQT